MAKKDSQLIVYNTLCKDRNNMPPFLSIVKFATASEDNPIEITHVDYIIDTKPFEEQAIKEKIEEIRKVQLENARYLDEERKKLQEKEKTLNEEITKRRQSFNEKELSLNNTEQELLTRETLLSKWDNNITAREVSHEISLRKTFWRPYIIGTSCFLAGGLLCYYGHSKIDSFIAGIASFWRKN